MKWQKEYISGQRINQFSWYNGCSVFSNPSRAIFQWPSLCYEPPIQVTKSDFLCTRWRSLSCNINLLYFRLVSHSRSLPDTICFLLTTICMHHYLRDSCHIFAPVLISFTTHLLRCTLNTLSYFINGFASYFSKRINPHLHGFEFTTLRVQYL